MTAAGEDLLFEAARAADIEALVSIDAGSPRPWDAQAFLAEQKKTPPTLFVLRMREVIAFVVIRVQDDAMDIVNLAVTPLLRRQGFGTRLLRALLEHSHSKGIRTAFLEVREGNREARKLYASFGFEETQRRRAFYQKPTEDALLMRLELG